MENFNTRIKRESSPSGKYRRIGIMLTLFALFFAGNLKAQGGCGDMTPSFINYEPCKYRVKIVNTSIDCFSPTITVLLDQGAFETWSANTAGGWTGQELAPNIVQLTYSGPTMPIDSSFPMIFTLPTDLVTLGNFQWEYTCFPGESCTIFPGIELTSCPDPQDASIIGVKYKECGSLPYNNQTPLGGWTIQAIDVLGNIKEGVTEADGTYAIYDLPKGQYIVREVQQPGWTPKVPISGEMSVNLAPSQQRIVNFGNCPPQPPPCDCPAGTQPGGNAVVNGNFSGSGGFNTAYTLNNNNPPLQPGQYWIGSNPSAINAGFAACGDHSTGSGNMMVVNGAANQNTTIWSQTFTMAPNSTYKFEAWLASLSSASPAQLSVFFLFPNLNVQYEVQRVFAPVTTCTWERICYAWTNGPNTNTVTIFLVNQNVATTGNDFAIDDLSFSRCVNPHGTVTGRVYQTCDSMAYTNQQGLGGQTVQLLDTMGNLIDTQVTDTSGGYAFADLPLGWYWVKVAQQGDDVPNYPASGLHVIELEAGETEVLHFGLCRLPQLPCNCPLNSSPGTNLVFNSNFDGNGGFTSGFTQNTLGPPLLLDQYWVGNHPDLIDADFHSCDDHTPGLSNMLVAKGNLGGTSFPIYWEQGPITVKPNTTYVFSAWVAPLHGAYPDYIILEAGTTVVAVQKLSLAPCSWRRICGTWKSGLNVTSTTLKIRGFAVMSGDAIAIDDISLRECSSSVIGPLTGTLYRTCDAEPYNDQPVLSDWPVQLLDTMGNVVGEQLTDGSGEYAFYDLPLGVYWVRALTPNDWTPSLPASGQTLVDLNTPGQSAVQNFGLCQSCGVCPPPTDLVLTVLGPTSALLRWTSSGCSEREWTYVDETLWIHTLSNVSEVVLNDLEPGVPHQIYMVSSCSDSSMSVHSDTVVFYYPCFGGNTNCSANLLSNGSFEGPGSAGLPNAADQIGLCSGWQQATNGAGVSSIADWYTDGYTTTGFWPGSYNDVPNQQYTFLHASCGYRYAGFDLNTCEGITAPLSATIGVNTGYNIGFWWSPKEPVTSNFTFLAILSGSNCTVNTANGGTVCSHQCSGDFHIPVSVTTVHQPGTWYFHTYTANAPMTVNSLTFTAQSSGPKVNNYIYLDEVCVQKIFQICNVSKPRITHSADQPNAFYGEAELGPGTAQMKYIWDFGDGTQDTACCPGSVIHDFAPGNYEVCLTVVAMDTSGTVCSNSTCIPVNITTQSTKCDHIAAFLYPALIGEDCCYSLNTNNTEPNCFTQLDVTLSSGSFVNTQFDPNWNVAINGNVASLTPALGGFIPVGQEIPMTICDPGGTDPYTVDIDFVYAGDVCHRSIGYSCTDNCECLGFSNLQFLALQVPAPQPVPVDCDNSTPVVLPCVPNDVLYNLEGNFGCTNECISSIHYQFYDQNHNPLQNGLASYDSGLDYFNLNPGFKFPPGTYQLVLTGICGTGDTCYCTLNFTIELCGCCSANQNAFTQTVDNATSISIDAANCKATLNIGNLPCQRINWINWGDGSSLDIGPYTSGAMPMHTYAQSGNYTITFNASEINSNTGASCYVGTFTETIALNCPSCNCQESNLAFEQNGTSHPVLCGNPSQTPTFGCPVSDVTLTGSLGCVLPNGNQCTQSLISWNLYGPNGFVDKGTLTGPSLGITFQAVDISAPGTYTVSLQTLCPGQTDSCYCQLQWIQSACDPCCLGDYAAFLATAMNVQTFGTLGTCSLSFQGVGLTDCMQIRYDWGDNSSSGPFGDNTPVTHTYTQSGTYNVCYTIEEVNANGFACYTFQSCESVDVICNDCVCGSFTDMYARPTVGAPSIALSCGGNYTFGCPNPGFSIPITGKFECQGGNCAPSTTISWTLTGPSGSHSGSVPASPFFYLPILPTYYAGTGTYTLTLTGNCGGQPCTPCVITFNVNCPNPCPCDAAQLQIDVSKGFASALNIFSCSGCFAPIALNDCDMVKWSVNGGPVAGMTTGSQSFCYTFPGAGAHVITMTVIRKDSNGNVCAQASISKTVNVTCINWPDCSTTILRNATFSDGAVAGDLNSLGASEGWKALAGNPMVEEGVPGSNDFWTVQLRGNRDSADVLTQTEPICLAKTSGEISFRIARFPNNDCCLNMNSACCNLSKIGFGCKLNVQLFRGELFVLEYPYWNPIRCLKLISLDLPPLGTGWTEVQLPYDVTDWAVEDTCGSPPHGLLVRPVIYVTNELGHEQGGAETRSTVHIDNFCMDGTLVKTSEPLSKALRIFPNPNSGSFTVQLPEAAKPYMSFRITDLAGRPVLEQKSEPGSALQTVSAQTLPNGLYFLQVLSEGKVVAVEKFVKQ